MSGDAAADPSAFIDRCLDVFTHDILPLTAEGVRAGHRVFGAAVLLKADLSLVVAGTNNAGKNPLLHGEVSCLNRFWELPADARPAPADCIFLCSHEPCFDNFTYMFSYADTRDAFAMPHDLAILDTVFGVKEGAYTRSNTYWQCHYLRDRVAAAGASEERVSAWTARLVDLRGEYDKLGAIVSQLEVAIPV